MRIAKIVLVGVVFAVLVGFIVRGTIYEYAVSRFTDTAFFSARMAAAIVDGDSVADYLTYGTNEGYYATFNLLQELKIANGLRFLYILRFDRATQNIYYIFDIYCGECDLSLISRLGDIAGAYDVYVPAFMAVYETGLEMTEALITRFDVFGHLASAYIPIFASDGRVVAIACADLYMPRVFRDIFLQSLAFAVGSFAVYMAFVSFWIYTKKHSDNKRKAEELIRNKEELELAERVQLSMLPQTGAPAEENRFDIYHTMIPQKEIGGDFYDFFLLDGDTLVMVIADVSGKGIPAALFMANAKTTIKNMALADKTRSPGAVFAAVNNSLSENNGTYMYVTAFIGYLDLPSGALTYASAGHPPQIIKRKNEAFTFLPTGHTSVLGFGKDEIYGEATDITLSPGDIMYLYTDGVTDAWDKTGRYTGGGKDKARKRFSNEGLLKLLNAHGTTPPKGINQVVASEVNNVHDVSQNEDDITMMTLHYKG
ncbi:MAG: serine/threonine-protein phosphatase [Defluviitaleaceae bacterium]|nr:serine/threonine-protein phosphatase [Defluviitaleaceae bacterium]MCL2239664.1 serine/threonine-protein phosphatase [Defluviitaleaceae bacterium]